MHQDDCELNGISMLAVFLCLGSPIAMFSAIVNGAFVFFLFLLLGLPAVAMFAMFVYWKKCNNDQTNKNDMDDTDDTDDMNDMDDMDDMEDYETFGEFYEKRCCSCSTCCIKWHDQLILGGIMLLSFILLGCVGIILFGYWHCYKVVDEDTEKVETVHEFYKTRLAYICYGRCCVQEERIVIETEMVTEMENPIKTFDPLEQAQWKIKPSQLVIGKRIGAGGCVSTLTGLFLVPCLGHVYFLCKAPSHQVVFVLSFFVVFDCLLFLGMGLRRYIGWFGCIRPHCLQRSDFSDH